MVAYDRDVVAMRELTALTAILLSKEDSLKSIFLHISRYTTPVLMILKIRAKRNKPKTGGQKVDQNYQAEPYYRYYIVMVACVAWRFWARKVITADNPFSYCVTECVHGIP